MTVKELIKKLEEVKDENSLVFVQYQGAGGCDTCGYGGEVEEEVTGIDDLGGKIWLEME
jgi:hypothetical protein